MCCEIYGRSPIYGRLLGLRLPSANDGRLPFGASSLTLIKYEQRYRSSSNAALQLRNECSQSNCRCYRFAPVRTNRLRLKDSSTKLGMADVHLCLAVVGNGKHRRKPSEDFSSIRDLNSLNSRNSIDSSPCAALGSFLFVQGRTTRSCE